MTELQHIAAVQLLCASVFPLAIVAVIINRLRTRGGIGVRVIQFTAASMTLPSILLLAMGDYIGAETSAALIGAFIGYLFANIGNFDSRQPPREKQQE